jgi:hypothetical protein
MASFHDPVLGGDLLPLVLSHARREQAFRWACVSTTWKKALVRNGAFETLELRGRRVSHELSAALASRLVRDHLRRLSAVDTPETQPSNWGVTCTG